MCRSTRSWLFHTRLAESRPQTQVNRSDSHQAPHRILSQQKASVITTAPPRVRGPLGRAFDRGSIHIRTLGLTFHACTPLAKRRVCEINIEPGCAPLSLSCTCVCTWCDPVVQQDACWLGGELCSCCLVPLARTSTGAIATGGADADLAWFCDLFVVIINRYSVRLREYLINRLGLKTVQATWPPNGEWLWLHATWPMLSTKSRRGLRVAPTLACGSDAIPPKMPWRTSTSTGRVHSTSRFVRVSA
jgi:hypothetical protein